MRCFVLWNYLESLGLFGLPISQSPSSYPQRSPTMASRIRPSPKDLYAMSYGVVGFNEYPIKPIIKSVIIPPWKRVLSAI